MALLAATTCGYGVFLLGTAALFSWRGLGIGPRTRRGRLAGRARLVRAGLSDVRSAELAAMVTVMAVAGAGFAFALFGGVLPSVIAAAATGLSPVASARSRRVRRRAVAQEAWPRMIEEMRVLVGSAGRSVPQALLDVGLRGPVEMRPAFATARREWLLSTDFGRTADVLKRELADPTADAACETLLVAHEIGGSDVDRRLATLATDRMLDIQERRDARARQAGVRFARRFVLLVPMGMAVAGLGIGDGRAAFATTSGQLAVAIALAMVAACWVWAGHLLKLPVEPRVFAGPGAR